jgi:hypothetical protein
MDRRVAASIVGVLRMCDELAANVGLDGVVFA